jgi:hypothetical protein
MLILFSGCYTVRLWALFPTFRRCILSLSQFDSEDGGNMYLRSRSKNLKIKASKQGTRNEISVLINLMCLLLCSIIQNARILLRCWKGTLKFTSCCVILK